MPQAMPLTDYISQSSYRKRMYKTKAAKFNNGYRQAAPDGINDVVDTWTVSYEALSLADRNTVVAALDAVKGWDYLTWQALGDSTTKRWAVQDGWSESTNGTTWSISFILEQTQ